MTAQGIETRSATTAGRGPKGESPVPSGMRPSLRTILHTLLTPLHKHQARKRLQIIVDRTANSREIIDYRINRARAKAGWRKRKGLSA